MSQKMIISENTKHKLTKLFGINNEVMPMFSDDDHAIITGYLTNISNFIDDTSECCLIIASNANTRESFMNLLNDIMIDKKVVIKIDDTHTDGEKEVIFFSLFSDALLYSNILTEQNITVYPIIAFGDNNIDFNEDEINEIKNYIFGGTNVDIK